MQGDPCPRVVQTLEVCLVCVCVCVLAPSSCRELMLSSIGQQLSLVRTFEKGPSLPSFCYLYSIPDTVLGPSSKVTSIAGLCLEIPGPSLSLSTRAIRLR